jgi:hypothetical protein
MVRAILDGRKTQTRRVVKPQPEWIRPAVGRDGIAHGYCGSGPENGIRCPYGQPGDRLWVRETWAPVWEDDTGFCGVGFRAGGMPEEDKRAGDYMDGTDRWRSPVTMPHWASRITLEIESVRVERLNEISEEDAKAEGICQFQIGDIKAYGLNEADRDSMHSTAKDAYRSLWESINGPGSWTENPWVWVVTFRVA